MEIRERQSGDVAIVELAGRLTINDEPGQLKEAVATLPPEAQAEVLGRSARRFYGL